VGKRQMDKEKRIDKFTELVYGLGDILTYNLKRYDTNSALKNIKRLCSLVDKGGLHDQEIKAVTDVLRRLSKVAHDFDNEAIKDFIDGRLAEEHNG